MKEIMEREKRSDSQIIEAFYEKARRYCSYIDGRTVREEDAESIIYLLMDVYMEGLLLPSLEPDTTDEEDPSVPEPKISFEIPTCYWEVFNGFHDEDIVAGDLQDDLASIYTDLMEGILLYDAGRVGDAVFEWNFGQTNHWGQHLTDAVRALHQIKAG